MINVSVITPSHNAARFISETIQSVLNQEYTDWEMIVVDDCSTDNSVSIIHSFVEQDRRIKLIQLSENSGAAVARNAAIKASQGRYIAFLDSDDVWLPDKLEKQIAFMQENDVAFSYAAYEKIDVHGHVFETVDVPKSVVYSGLLKKNCIGCLTAIYDTEKLGKIYMPLIRKRQDLGLWLRILKKTPSAHATPGVLSQYRVRNDSISANKRVAAQYTWKLYREVEGLSFFVASYYFAHYAVNGILHSKLTKLMRFKRIFK